MQLNNEAACSYSCTVGMEMLNGYGVMKPAGYQSLVMEVAGRHLRQFGVGVDDLIPKGMSWVLVSSSVDIVSPIRAEISLTARTWHSQQDRLTFRRELTFEDGAGEVRFNATTFSVLMDINERRILRPERVDLDIGQPYPVFVTEASPKVRLSAGMLPCDRRKVYPSCIDRLGHTNNCRYSEFAYDALTESEIAAFDRVSRIDVWYKSELKQGETFTLRRSSPEVTDGELYIDGLNDATGKQSFICRMLYSAPESN